MAGTFELINKNQTLIASVGLSEGRVPRVGEVIELPPRMAEDAGRINTAMVIDVRWRFSGGEFVPTVVAQAKPDIDADFRRLKLDELGWLPAAE